MRLESFVVLAALVMMAFTPCPAPATFRAESIPTLENEYVERATSRTPFGFSLPYQGDAELFLFSW
jgi:hypothetical protein